MNSNDTNTLTKEENDAPVQHLWADELIAEFKRSLVTLATAAANLTVRYGDRWLCWLFLQDAPPAQNPPKAQHMQKAQHTQKPQNTQKAQNPQKAAPASKPVPKKGLGLTPKYSNPPVKSRFAGTMKY